MIQGSISYEEIRSKKLEEYGTEFKDWIWILVKQYKDRTHFLFELLQNAEDAKASDVRLHLMTDKLVIEHNGVLFSHADVVSITKVAKSTKSGDANGNIGRFGIGFKSVYAYASTPRIYSGAYSFEIRDFIYPYDIAPIPLQEGWTRIEIPFNNGEIAPEKAFSEIMKALREQIRSETLLFLNNICHLEISIQGGQSPISISKEDRERKGTGGNVLDVNILYTRNHKQQEDNYLLFTNCEEEAVCIAFKVEGKELVPVPNTNIFTFFPTDKESHQSFYIHAPFDTTPARDNIVEDSERNKCFVQNICDGIQMAFCWMRDNGYLSLSGMNGTYPIYQYPEETIFYSIYQRAIRIIGSGEKLIPTNQPGVFKSRDEILLPDNMQLVELFDDDDIQRLFTNHRIFWIAKEIAKDNCQQLRDFLRKNFNFKTYTWRDVISRMNDVFLRQKDIKWFERLFIAIRSFTSTDGAHRGSHDIDVRSIPFVRLMDGSQICAYSNGHPAVYTNNPGVCPNKIHRSFLANETIRRYYSQNLQIPDYNVVTIVADNILPKYKTRETVHVSLSDLRENISDLKTIKDALQMNPGIADTLSEAYLVTDGKSWYRPEELHIPSALGSVKPEYRLVEGVLKLKFLSPQYETDPKLDEKFFIAIGCAASLRRTKIDQKEYLALVERYLGKQEQLDIRKKIFNKTYQEGIDWSTLFEGFPEVLLQGLDEKKSKGMAKFLNRYAGQFQIKGEAVGAQDYNFSGANVDSMQIYSAIGLLLTFIPWIYTKDGVKKTVTEVYRRDIDSAYEKDARRLLDLLPFMPEDKALEELLSKFEEGPQKELIKELFTNQDSLQQVAKAWQTMKVKELKKNKKNQDPQEILSEMSKKKAKGAAPAQEDEPDAIKNPERRKKKLEEEFGESMDFVINVPKTTLKYTYQDTLSSEEKSFLRMEYNGYCQICGTTILKHDGDNHFQAINVMRTSNLADAYKGALNTGWNSLCLCPNCAAKYLYGPKDVSAFYEQVQEKDVEAGSSDTIDIRISLQDKEESIHYSPKHFLALKTALDVFSKK